MLRIREKLANAFAHWFEVTFFQCYGFSVLYSNCGYAVIELVADAGTCQKEGFVYAHAPVMTSNDCEGAGEAFRIVSDFS